MMKKNENFNKLNKTDIKSKSVISSDKIGQNLEKNNEFEETNSQDSNRLFESLETLLHSYDLYKFDKMYNFFHQNALIDFEGKLQFKLYKSLRVLAYLNIDETKKIIEEGLTELNSIVNNDISIKKLKSSMNIVKFTCKYLTGDYKEALDFFLSMKNNYIINSIPQYSIELDLNIASIRLLMGDIESCISVLNESYNTVLKSNLDYYQIIVPQILGDQPSHALPRITKCRFPGTL